MVERLGEMTKGRREMIEKGSREGDRKKRIETKRQFQEDGLRACPPPPAPPQTSFFLEFSTSDPAM